MAHPSDDPLQRYQIMDPLGRGGSGHTFRAVDRATQRQVAIKVLSLRDLDDWKRFDLFEREAAVLGTLDHPGIPHYIDHYASEATGDYFLVMELVEGAPLSHRIRDGQRLDGTALRAVLDQVLAILDYLHELSPPVIHRDIKPANLVLDRSDRVHLVDFGGVRKAARAEGNSTMVGTFGYMAPEQLHGEATEATDLYALGATIAALHAGVEADQLPHDGLHIDLDALELPAALAPALRRMLEPNPKQRVRTVAEVRQILRMPKVTAARQAAAARAAAPSSSVPARRTAASDLPATTGGIRTLANVPRPLSVLVWIVSGLASGGLTIFQVVMLPLIFRLVYLFNRNKPPRQLAELEGNLRRLREDVVQARRSFKYVAGQTNPIRDDDDAT